MSAATDNWQKQFGLMTRWFGIVRVSTQRKYGTSVDSEIGTYFAKNSLESHIHIGQNKPEQRDSGTASKGRFRNVQSKYAGPALLNSSTHRLVNAF
jgi:hypothetical protein